VEGLTDDWTEEKLKEICKQFGEIVEIKLAQNLGNTRRKDFGFVTFASRESAQACVEGINDAHIGGKVKVVKLFFPSPSLFFSIREQCSYLFILGEG